ncbi:MAG: histidine ammonia-lyase [Xanthomonadales bacterium]|nr:histidine ammonia-lyase [Xanthomonadales bacterium]
MAATRLHLRNLYADLDTSMAALNADHSRVSDSRKVVEQALTSGKAHYGINTGFGILANKRISTPELSKLQRNILLSHACGVGDPVPHKISKLMLQLKIHSLGLGFSGISNQTFAQLRAYNSADLIARIPSQGSVGASGDLAPLAHMCLPLIGCGEVWNQKQDGFLPAAERMDELGLTAVELSAKDGLALINGTQLMLAYGSYCVERALKLCKAADILASMSLEALQGSAAPYDARVHAVRPHKGQIQVAANVRALLKDSEIMDSHRNCGKVQDPYSLRCVPQVHGASRDAFDAIVNTLEVELNSVTDNPLVFPDGDIISGGNFHGQPLALSLDYAAIALAELASISERRCYLLLEGHDGLPTLLMSDTGVNSGFMIPQYTAAALVSENKILCHPASVDSIPTSLGQEDHVSMGSISALKLLSVLKNVERVLAVELLCAAQALDFRRPIKPGKGVDAAYRFLRERINHAEEDYEVRNDLDICAEILRSGELVSVVEQAITDFS